VSQSRAAAWRAGDNQAKPAMATGMKRKMNSYELNSIPPSHTVKRYHTQSAINHGRNRPFKQDRI
jgi:hypothetical protein